MALHQSLLGAIVDRYLVDYATPKPGVPRFLLNDVVRYWRTIAVDYQAKRWEVARPDWGLRYLKLRVSRKLTFAATLAVVLLCTKAERDSLVDGFSMPVLARLGRLVDRVEPARYDDVRELFRCADAFTGRLSDGAFRESMSKIRTSEEAFRSDAFRDVYEVSKRLEASLERIFFDSEALAGLTRKYLAF